MKPLLMIVDDDQDYLESLHLMYESVYDVRTASTEEEAIALAREIDRGAVLLMDLHLNGILSGIDVLKRMCANARFPLIPVYVSGDDQSVTRAMSDGLAFAFYVKPLPSGLIETLVEKQGQTLINAFTEIKWATRDPLTGLNNRRGLEQLATVELAHAVRNKTYTAALYIDLDDLASINNQYGHAAGDKAVFALAEVLHEVVRRATDIVARIGGDEFVVILPDTRRVQARRIASQIEVSLKRIQVQVRAASIPLGASIGIAVIDSRKIIPEQLSTSLWNLINKSDAEMYNVKRSKKQQS